uniref:Ribosomal protein S16 n=1 Tax=Polypodium glycyrrhiza TaxID=38390 RepID=A0A0B5EH50_9MONI|nr:ribosomal protein S16 [Polypodium glycyrrhiza]
MVKPRLKQHDKKQRTYQIVTIDTQFWREQDKCIQEVGFYNPHKEQTQLDLSIFVDLLKQVAQSTATFVIF